MKCLRTVHDTTVGVLVYIVAHCSSFILCRCHFLCLLQLHGQINARSRQSRTMAVIILRVQPEKRIARTKHQGMVLKDVLLFEKYILKGLACRMDLLKLI